MKSLVVCRHPTKQQGNGGKPMSSPKTDAVTDQLRGGGVFGDRLEVGLSPDKDEG